MKKRLKKPFGCPKPNPRFFLVKRPRTASIRVDKAQTGRHQHGSITTCKDQLRERMIRTEKESACQFQCLGFLSPRPHQTPIPKCTGDQVAVLTRWLQLSLQFRKQNVGKAAGSKGVSFEMTCASTNHWLQGGRSFFQHRLCDKAKRHVQMGGGNVYGSKSA
eukprot:s1767_g6.t1